MANEADRLSTILDTLWNKSVPTAKKTAGVDHIVKHLMGAQFTPANFAALSKDQKADAILTAVRAALMKMVCAGGQIETRNSLEQQVVDGGNDAVAAFDPDL